MATVTLSTGQAVAWRAAPGGFAQVEELRRTRVRLVYRTRRGTIRHATVRVDQLTAEPLLLDLFNPFDRGVVPRSKTFTIDGAAPEGPREPQKTRTSRRDAARPGTAAFSLAEEDRP